MKNQLAILLATESNDALSISSCDGLKSCGAIGEKSLRGDLTDLDLKVTSFDDIGTSGPTGIWINSSDQSLWMTDSFRESPDPPFPFSRVAAITSKQMAGQVSEDRLGIELTRKNLELGS